MVRKRIRDAYLDGLRGNTLNTIPYQDEKPELIQLNKALSKADTRHDIPIHIGPGVFTTTLNIVYGEQIQIIPGPPVVSYIDDRPSNDIFTNAIKSQVSSYQLNSVNFNFEGNPYAYALPSLSGPMPKHSSIPYFMRTLETGIELLEGDTKIVVVSDNASANAVHRTIKKQSEIFLRNANAGHPTNAEHPRAPITEAVTLASIIDMAGKSVPPNWAELFHAWWDNCVGEDFNNFIINLTDIGAVNMGNTGLTIRRNRGNQITQGIHGSLEVGIVIDGRAPVNILYDLNQQSLEQSIVRNPTGRNPTGEYIFVSGKNIAKVFFEQYQSLFQRAAADLRLNPEILIETVASAVSDATRIPIIDTRRHVQYIFETLQSNFDLIGKYFIVGKLIGDLLCPLCCDDKWYTLTNDNLMIARCLLLSKRALFSKHSNQFSGFYFFVPQEQPAIVQRAALRVQQEARAAVRQAESAAQEAADQATAEEAAARAEAVAQQTITKGTRVTTRSQAATAARAAADQAQAAAQQTITQATHVITRAQAAAQAAQALQEAVTRRNQELGRRIQEGKLNIDRLQPIIDKRIQQIDAEVNREQRLNTNRSIVTDEDYIKHKLYCKSKIESIFHKFLNGDISFNDASREINKINKSIGASAGDISLKNRTYVNRLRNIRFNSDGEIMIGGTGTSTTITVKWNKEVFDNIPVALSEPVSELKVQLFSLTGVAPEKQKVIMDGKTLKDKESLESYGVKQGSVLQMIGNASETWVKPDMKVKFVDDLSTSEQATDNSQYPSEDVLKICGGYANVVIQVFKSDMINKIEEILKGNNEKRNFIFGVGNQPIIGVRPEAENFIESLKSFLKKVIEKIENKDNLFMLQIFGDVISHLEDILSITIPIIFQSNGDIIIPFCTDYNKVSHVCLLLGINIEDIKIEGESFEKQFDNFKELFPNVPERILPTADIPTIVRNLVTSILNKTIPTEALHDIYGLLKGEDLETILSSNKDNINNLYYNVIPEVLGIMHSYGVFTEAEEVEFYIIQAIIENKDSVEHAIITKSIYSLYQNITVLYGIYVYDAEILKTFIENIKLKNNMIQYDGGFNSLQTIMDYRCGVEFETMVKDTTTYVSLNQFMQQQEQKIKELEQSDKTMLDTERLHALDLNKINEREQLTRLQTAGSKGGKNNRISNPKHNTKYRKNYKKFVSKYIIKKKKNNKNNKKNNNKNNKKNNNKKKNNKNKTKKNKRLTKSKPNSKRNNKTLKNKKGKSKSKSSNHKSKYNKKTKTNYYNSYRHNKTLKH